MNIEQEELMLDLLAKEAVYGLDESEHRQLAELELTAGSGYDRESFEMTAAVISMHGLDTKHELPKNLQARIVADAERFFDEKEATDKAAATSEQPGRKNGFSLPAWLGWAVAAAACIALAVNLYTGRTVQVDRAAQVPTPTPEVKLDPAQSRQKLIESAPDLAKASWGSGNVGSVKPAGDLVWSDSKQTGYMRLQGLPVNDPGTSTYQLWIFDETQDDKTPIDGGTFNVNSDGEVIIPINAKLAPRNTKMFAITIEKPGGVVVSKREKIVALAKRET